MKELFQCCFRRQGETVLFCQIRYVDMTKLIEGPSINKVVVRIRHETCWRLQSEDGSFVISRSPGIATTKAILRSYCAWVNGTIRESEVGV